MLQNNKTGLQQKASEDFIADSKIVDLMTKMGFHPQIVDMSLRYASNNMDEAVDMLLRMQSDGTYEDLLTSIGGSTSNASLLTAATTSTGESAIKKLADDANAMAVCNINDLFFILTLLIALSQWFFLGISEIFRRSFVQR